MSCAARTLSHYLAGLLAGFAAGITIGAARAQETSPERHQLDRATITGTLIPRAEEETALPIVRIKGEELARAGVTNAEGAMQWVTQSQGGLPTAASTSTFTGAAAYANLRALGAQRTLVLLNGRRVVTNPYATVAVDLNTLPFASVQRIDVLTDGASATYGRMPSPVSSTSSHGASTKASPSRPRRRFPRRRAMKRTRPACSPVGAISPDGVGTCTAASTTASSCRWGAPSAISPRPRICRHAGLMGPARRPSRQLFAVGRS